MYCHLHTQLKTYEAKPKPLGLAFGGSIGNERIFIDEDFSKVTVRHHAVDKTYQHGSLIPNQVKSHTYLFSPDISLFLYPCYVRSSDFYCTS
jgi:hypothetical protein